MAGGSEVAEVCFSFLHIELVQLFLGEDGSASSTAIAKAGRRIEAVGYEVGQRLVERYTRDRPRFADTLEVIKFVCKELWSGIYHKQIDKLQTNNRGVYMLQDTKHRLLARCSPPSARQESAKQMGALYAKFPAGLIRGALGGLGVIASVSVEVTELPSCQFTIRVQNSEGVGTR